jgi:hypothetical protein
MDYEEDLTEKQSDVALISFALSDCVVEIEAQSAKYLRAVHRTALELAAQNQYGADIGGFWLLPEHVRQLRMLPECYPSSEAHFVRRAIEAYLSAQLESSPLENLSRTDEIRIGPVSVKDNQSNAQNNHRPAGEHARR